MHIEFTEQERLLAQQGQPVDAIDPQTNEAYILLARQRFDEVRPHLRPPAILAEPALPEIPEGIRISQEAYRRELPELLKDKNLYKQWIAYHLHERIGIAPSKRTLMIDCFRRGLDDAFFVGWIHEYGLIDGEEEIEPRLHHYEEFHEDS